MNNNIYRPAQLYLSHYILSYREIIITTRLNSMWFMRRESSWQRWYNERKYLEKAKLV